MINLKQICKKAVAISFKEELKKNTKDSQSIRSPGRDPNLVPAEYEVVITTPT